jgi:hypothetical protein
MVAWMASASSVRVRRWEGSQWVSLPSGPELEPATTSHLELDAQGRPTVTWVQWGSSFSWATVYRLEGTSWTLLGRLGTGETASHPFIERAVGRLTSSGKVKLAWQALPRTFPGTSEVRVSSQDSSTSWGLMPHSTMASGWRGLVMEVDATDATVTAWCESVEGGMRVGVERWKSLQEPVVMPLPTRPSYVANPALVLQRNGNPVVAWSEVGAIQVHRWTGTAWEQLGQPFPTAPEQSGLAVPALALDASGQLLFAWSVPGKAELWRWAESGWVRLGEISRPTSAMGLSWPISLQVDGKGAPVLAWSREDPSDASVGSLEVLRLNR